MPKDNVIRFFNPLVDPQQSIVCPIKMLLVHALRTGQTYGVTIDEVLAHTSQRHDRTVQWKNPDYPVLCGIDRHSFLRPTYPAPANQLAATIKTMGLVAGILQPITANDVRNGSARDIAHLKKGMRGTDHRATALQIGHSEETVRSGTTAYYIGAMQDTIYNMRAAEMFEDRLAPRLAAQPFVGQKSKPADIDRIIEQQGGDLGDSNLRKRVSEALKSDAVRAWREREKERMVEPNSEECPPMPTQLPLAKRQKTDGKDRVGRLSLESVESSSSTLVASQQSQVLQRHQARQMSLLIRHSTLSTRSTSLSKSTVSKPQLINSPLPLASAMHLSMKAMYPTPSEMLLWTLKLRP